MHSSLCCLDFKGLWTLLHRCLFTLHVDISVCVDVCIKPAVLIFKVSTFTLKSHLFGTAASVTEQQLLILVSAGYKYGQYRG